MPEYLKQAGYRTGFVGKLHIGQGTEAMLSKTERDEYRKVRKKDALSQKRVDAAKPWKRGFDEGLFFVGGGGHYFPFREKHANNPSSNYFTFNGPDGQPERYKRGANAFKTDFLTEAPNDCLRSPRMGNQRRFVDTPSSKTSDRHSQKVQSKIRKWNAVL